MTWLFPLWLGISVPILAIFYILGIFFKNGALVKNKSLARYYVLPKCAGSYICVSGAALALACQKENPLVHLVFWALVLCMAGDFFIEMNIIAGGLSFGLAHCLLMAYVLSLSAISLASLVLWIAGIGAALLLFAKNIPSMGRLLAPFLVYITVLIGDFALAAPLAAAKKPCYILLAAGLLCFVASDMLLGKRHFGARQPLMSRLLMFLYYASLYLIQASLWLPLGA